MAIVNFIEPLSDDNYLQSDDLRQFYANNFYHLVYAVTHEYTEFGECYNSLYIYDYEEELDEMLYSQDNTYYGFISYIKSIEPQHFT